jgi:hypothetical protein
MSQHHREEYVMILVLRKFISHGASSGKMSLSYESLFYFLDQVIMLVITLRLSFLVLIGILRAGT